MKVKWRADKGATSYNNFILDKLTPNTEGDPVIGQLLNVTVLNNSDDMGEIEAEFKFTDLHLDEKSGIEKGVAHFKLSLYVDEDGNGHVETLVNFVVNLYVEKVGVIQFIEASDGGTISLQNSDGDKITLEIPPLALPESTSISITALAVPPPNPIANNIFPGVILGPPGLIFKKPIKIRVDFQDILTNPELAALFWLKDSNLISLIANQTRTSNSIEGEIDHFSTIIGGEPTVDEIMQAIFEIVVNGGDTSALGILETIGDYFTVMGFAQTLKALGDPKWVDTENSAKGLLNTRSLEILSSQLPSDPCGQYSQALMKLENIITSALGDAWLAEQIDNRICKLIVSPQNPTLNKRASVELTAELFDSNGNQHSCSSVDWQSSSDSVEIELAINNTCRVKAVEEGTADVTAKCEDYSDSATITVEGGTATYRLTWHFVFRYLDTSGWSEHYTGSMDVVMHHAITTYGDIYYISNMSDILNATINISNSSDCYGSCDIDWVWYGRRPYIRRPVSEGNWLLDFSVDTLEWLTCCKTNGVCYEAPNFFQCNDNINPPVPYLVPCDDLNNIHSDNPDNFVYHGEASDSYYGYSTSWDIEMVRLP